MTKDGLSPMDRGITVEGVAALTMPEDPQPSRDAIEISQLPLQAAQNGERCMAGGIVSLLLRDLRANLAQRLGDGAIGL